MTLYTGLRAGIHWQRTIDIPAPASQETIFVGADGVPIFGRVAIPDHPIGTMIGTYGITGSLENQWYLSLMERKAYARGYAVVLFDWRAHGKTAELSPTLTSDGLYEGEDFVRIANTAKAMGCPAPFWFTGYSLGGQLALWGVKAAQTLAEWGSDLALKTSEIAGGAVICPTLESQRSLTYLTHDPWGRLIEQSIVRQLKKLALQIHRVYPEAINLKAIERVNSIWEFDQELVIGPLGFSSVEAYYRASSGLYLLPTLSKPTLILYAADDPLFEPTLIPEVQRVCQANPAIDLMLTARGGHVGYISSQPCQIRLQDPDQWWAWNRVLDWCDQSGVINTG